MTLNELILKLEVLRDEAPGNGELPVYASDWGEDYHSPAPVSNPVVDRIPFQTQLFNGEKIVDVYVPEAVFVI